MKKSVSRYLVEIVEKEIHSHWPPNYASQVLGGWEGKPLKRPDQLKYEKRDAF